MRVINWFSDLGYLPDQIEFGPHGAVARRRTVWTLASLLLFIAGIFAKQIVSPDSIPDPNLKYLNLRVLAASSVVGFALFTPAMRLFNRWRTKPSIEHLLTSFTLGYFYVYVLEPVIKWIFHR
jgi:hypothetical protein